MAEPFIGEIMLYPYNFAPRNWAYCNGQILSIAQNQALFALLGTTYGGNGVTTFALPDLRGRVPTHEGQGPGLSPYSLGQQAGVETVTLNATTMPQHTHVVRASSATTGGTTTPNSNFLGGGNNVYRTGSPTASLQAASAGPAGGGQPHTNVQPYLTLSWCICLVGIFPSRN